MLLLIGVKKSATEGTFILIQCVSNIVSLFLFVTMEIYANICHIFMSLKCVDKFDLSQFFNKGMVL